MSDTLTYEHDLGHTQATEAGSTLDDVLHRDPEWTLVQGARHRDPGPGHGVIDLESFDPDLDELHRLLAAAAPDDVDAFEDKIREILELIALARTTPPVAGPSDDELLADTDGLKRSELDQIAAEEGVEEPEKLPNIDAVRDAILTIRRDAAA
ncbi:hypothetical protein PAI11_37500 [Patulibacter medicamentivorans]|uniref:Uncharacterized protein n=1 Tax=Patulibacter medicamentivorans TaxID=1097667 RepID=H0EA76_9ACTN|nr:hypothetical protein [Patulibacter medicamentivorans]EHN09416.1 hypothetical protein PAI11_37500 [Patulibacter medicamentivorans]